MTAPEKKRPSRRRGCLISFLVAIGLILLSAAISALTNIGLPQSQVSSQLDPLDKSRLGESLNIKAELGRVLWPEWAAAENPIILWDRAYEFLLNFPGTPPHEWEKVPQDDFNGSTYYRRPAVDPQNFAMPVGDLWAASITTKTETDVFLIDTFRSGFPPPLRQVFPYRLFIQPSETQICAVLHEDFHVFERQVAPNRLAQAEAAHHLGDKYDQVSAAFETGLRQEAGLLANALEARTDAQAREDVRQFLQAREERRASASLDPQLIDYERWLEWEEGMAKYVEVFSYRLAAQTASFSPLPEMARDPDFKSYRKYSSRWSQELYQLRHPSGSGETRFYNLGMAQSFLLDRLKPDWKDTIMQAGFFLEDLLRQAVIQ